MGAKTWMLVYSNGDAAASLKKNSKLDREKTVELLAKLFPKEKLEPIADGTLAVTCPEDNIIYAGSIGDVFVVAAVDFGIDYPSKLDSSFLNLGIGNTIHLHAMHSVVDWFAFALWKNTHLERSLSLSPDSGIMEDIGNKLPFEVPYWNGKHPAVAPEDQDDDEQPYPIPFHTLDLGEAALRDFFGYILEGVPASNSLEPDDVPLMGFKRGKKPFWKIW